MGKRPWKVEDEVGSRSRKGCIEAGGWVKATREDMGRIGVK